MDDEMTPIDNDEMMDLFGDGFEEEVTEVSTKVPEVPEETEISEETPLEEDILEQTPGEIEETIVLDESTDAQIEEMEEDEGEGIVILHPDNMQELANFIGEDGIDQLTSIMEGDLSGEYDNIIYISPLASNDDTPRNVKLLRSILGEKSADLIQKVAKIQGKSLDDIVRLRKLPDNLNRIDVLDDAVGTPHFLQIFDDQGGDITSIIGLELDAVGQLEVDTVFAGSAMTALKEGEKCYSPSAMGKSVETPFENFYHIMSDRERRLKRIEVLQWIRKLVSRLNAVFGFDDYRQLEAFVAAWLMRNATCRLSGIPGTGKTTVINCAATLLGNSYGFHINKTYLATDSTMSYYPKDYDGNHRYTDEKQIFASNTSVSNAHVADVVPSGQAYNVMYNDQRNESTYRNWDSWRFRDWKAPQPGVVERSGSYTYDFNFLRAVERADERLGLPVIDDDDAIKKALSPEQFHKILFNCWEAEVPDDFDLDLWSEVDDAGQRRADRPHWKPNSDAFLEKKKAGKTRMVVKPIQIHDGSSLTEWNSNDPPTYGPFPMTLRYPDYDSRAVADAMDHVTELNEYVDRAGQNGLYTDTGRNEGYYLRHLMCHWFRDSRTDPRGNGQFDISVEMLREIGVAKIDYDKRPDEVLYGLEIRAVEAVNQSGETVNTYEFEPVPREIVTQPVKFFNEANRSQSGVEDAVLGLIAEKLVEYRGKTFKSPDFVAWMDTNPHQKGNDLAFTDRIDMELLFKSVSLGGRYDQLVNKFSSQGGLEPNRILLSYMMTDVNNPNWFRPMRIANLASVWEMVGKETALTSPGSSYDGFRDISVISVLFSQIFAKRPSGVNLGQDSDVDYTFANADDEMSLDLYESPLLDYSTTTNTNTSDKGTTSPVLNDDTMIFGSMEGGDGPFNLPVVFTRVLGFRFTNSLVKLAQAFAFLRGRESVSRQEILDAVPYVIAHRMGRAKAGAKDMEGNNKGLDGNRIGYVNEQEFVREMVVKGYLEGKNTDLSAGDEENLNLMDNVDYYYQHCRSVMDSVPAVWEYEESVIRPLYAAISDNDGVEDLTPIHWHIATMVIEEERKGRGRKVNRNYAASMAGPKGSPAIQKAPTNYPEMYANYESLILNPSPNGEPCLYDYYRLRGFIAREPNLFTNDRERLLRMLAGEVRTVAGYSGLELDIEMGSDAVIPFPQAITPKDASGNLTRTTYHPVGEGPWPRPEQIYWHTYDDAQGAWGSLIGFGEVQTYDLTNSASPLSVEPNVALTAANQSLRVSGRYKQTANKNQSISKYDISKTLNQFAKNFRNAVGQGMNLGDDFPNSVTATPISFDDWIKRAQAFLISKISDPTGSSNDNLWACFELNHAPVVTPQMGLRGVKGDDKLRLWLRLSLVGQSQAESGVDLIDMLFTVGITSAPALTGKANIGLEAQGPDFEILGVTDAKQYASKQWTSGNIQQGYKTNTALVDSGNMLFLDRMFYNNLFARSLE